MKVDWPLVEGIMATLVVGVFVLGRGLGWIFDEIQRFKQDEDRRPLRFVLIYLPHLVDILLGMVCLPALTLATGAMLLGRDDLESSAFRVVMAAGVGLMLTTAWRGVGYLGVKLGGMAPRTKAAWEKGFKS